MGKDEAVTAAMQILYSLQRKINETIEEAERILNNPD